MEVSQLYEQDFYAWAIKNAELLRQGRISEVDAMHLAEELEDMGKSNRRALLSRLQVLITHLLKYQRQPHLRSRSWEMTIRNQRDVIHDLLQESPSLRTVLNEPDKLAQAYIRAMREAVAETGLAPDAFPAGRPFTLEQMLDPEFWPE
jgi:uncharacterized Zn finger protein